jgi:hypothetical protein
MDLIGSLAIVYFILFFHFEFGFELCYKFNNFEGLENYNFELNAFLSDGSEDEHEFLAHIAIAIPFKDDKAI